MKFGSMLACLFCLIVSPVHAAKIYKWVGPDGQVHYSSTPPPEVEAESTGIKTTTDKKSSRDDSDEESLTDEERIRRLEEKIKELEDKGVTARKSHKPDSSGEPDPERVDEEIAEEDKQPDFSVQGQLRMIEEENRRQRLMTRCRAKAPHGTDCTEAENYKKY